MMIPFKIQCWNAYDAAPGTESMKVCAEYAHYLNEPCENDPGPLPVPWTTIPDPYIGCYAADGSNLLFTTIST